MFKIELRKAMEGYTQALVYDNSTMTLYEDRDKTIWKGDVWDLFSDVIEAEGFSFCYKNTSRSDNSFVVWCDDDVMFCEIIQENVVVVRMQCNLVKEDESQYTMEQAILSFIRNGLVRNITVLLADGTKMEPAPCKVTFVET